MIFMRMGRCLPCSWEGTLSFRPRRLSAATSYRSRSLPIQAKKSSPLNPSTVERGKPKKKSSRIQIVDEEPDASGLKGRPIPPEDLGLEVAPMKVENMSVSTMTTSPVEYLREDPVRGLTIVSGGVLGLWLMSAIILRLLKKRKKPEPTIQVSKMNELLKEKEEKMTDEFERLLSEQLEQKEDEHRQQLIEHTAKQESEFDGRLAAREREVRRILEAEFKTQIETETENLKTEMEKRSEELAEQLKQQFEDDKAQIEMEWMKKMEEIEKEKAEREKTLLETEKLVEELKKSQEHLKQHEQLLEDHLKEYESTLKSLKESHQLELEHMINRHRDEIRELKEEIRLQEIDIEKRRQAKEEEEMKRSMTPPLPDNVQENGHVDSEMEAKAVALQTKAEPEVDGKTVHSPEILPLHQNGVIGEDVYEAEIQLVLGGTIIPHVDKVMRGGEDAFFVNSTGYGAMGVADGVGSWAADGVDPSAYAKELMSTAKEYLTTSTDRPLSLLHCMQHAHEISKAPGSATMCLAIVQPDGVLEVVNLGDCGVRVFRGSKCVFGTETMQHEFNMPYQLGNPMILTETDWPSDAELYSLELKEGDVVVMGSDGLFDNMWDDDLTRIVNAFVGDQVTSQETAEMISKRIADVAHFNAKQKKIRSPWSVQAAHSGAVPMMKRLFPEGGKMDDCTVVVGFAHRFP